MPTNPTAPTSGPVFPFTRLLFAGLLLAVLVPISTADGQDTSVTELRDRLSAEDADVRVDAARQLCELGAAANPAVPELQQALLSDDLLLKYEAARCLGKIGPDASPCVSHLLALSGDDAPLLRHVALNALRRIAQPSDEIRQAFEERMKNDKLLANRVVAARALAEFAAIDDEQPLPPAAIRVLTEGLKSPQAHVSSEATRGLAAVGAAATSPILDVFRNGSPTERINATEALAALGLSARDAGPTLLSALQDADGSLKRHIIRALPSIGANPAIAIPQLQQLLQGKSRELRLSAVAALGEYGEQAAPAAAGLARLLADDDLLVQRDAAAALGKLGPQAASAVPQLIAALRDGAGAVTIEAAQALTSIGQPAVQPLTGLLQNPDYRNLAAAVLGDIGPPAVDAVPAILEMLDAPDTETRRAALLALAGIGPAARPAAAERLVQLLREPNGNVRAGAAYALARMEAQQAVPDLLKLVGQTDDDREKLAAAWALVMLQPSANISEKAVPILMDGLDDNWALVRKECVIALGALDERAQPAAKRLLSLADDPDPLVRAEASAALYHVGTDAETLVPVMTNGLDDVSPAVRYASVYVLGLIGPPAAPAVLRLKEMMNSHVSLDRILAAWALVKVSPSDTTARQALPTLLQALNHPRPQIRREVASVLGEIKGRHPEIAQALEKAKSDTNADVRAAVREALDKRSSGGN